MKITTLLPVKLDDYCYVMVYHINTHTHAQYATWISSYIKNNMFETFVLYNLSISRMLACLLHTREFSFLLFTLYYYVSYVHAKSHIYQCACVCMCGCVSHILWVVIIIITVIIHLLLVVKRVDSLHRWAHKWILACNWFGVTRIKHWAGEGSSVVYGGEKCRFVQ